MRPRWWRTSTGARRGTGGSCGCTQVRGWGGDGYGGGHGGYRDRAGELEGFEGFWVVVSGIGFSRLSFLIIRDIGIGRV